MDMQLAGRRVLVTGGTRGVGRAIVEGCLDEEANVAFCARGAAAIAATEQAPAGRAGSLRGTVEDVAEPHGSPHGCVHS